MGPVLEPVLGRELSRMVLSRPEYSLPVRQETVAEAWQKPLDYWVDPRVLSTNPELCVEVGTDDDIAGMRTYPLCTKLMSSVPDDVDPASVDGATSMWLYCTENNLFGHITAAHSIAWVRMQSVIVATILQCAPSKIAGSWRSPTDTQCTSTIMDLVAHVPEKDAGTPTGLTSRVDELKVCEGTAICPYHVHGRDRTEYHIQVQGHSWVALFRCEMALLRVSCRRPHLEGVAWYSDFSAVSVTAPMSRSLTASEIVMLAKDIDRTSRLVHDTKCVVVCVHIIIHDVMNLMLAIGDARCTASMRR